MTQVYTEWAELLRAGTVIPAHPLALTESLDLAERHQRALTRYYCAAGAGGVAVGVHTTQFEIHHPSTGLLEPVLALAAETVDAHLAQHPRPFVKIAGLIGSTEQAVREAELALRLGYHAGLLSLAALRDVQKEQLIRHCECVAEVLPIVGFYLQPAVGGRTLDYSFWRRFVEIENVVAIKIAPFNRYQTLDVVRAVVDAGQVGRIALYTGNDDNILADLVTDYVLDPQGEPVRIVGGLLGQWAVWTRRAVEMLAQIHAQQAAGEVDHGHWLGLGTQMTDANGVIFDAANHFRGCIPGIHLVLQRQGLLPGIWTLNPHEQLAANQMAEVERVMTVYPHLTDDEFVATHRDEWLRP